nr:50S ribosomal protein 6, chloroplastic [Coffea arabica]
MVTMPNPVAISGGATKNTAATRIVPAGDFSGSGGVGLVIECSSRPQKKATAHHKKTRPRKSQPWDIRRRGPTVYPPLPPLPPEWTFVSETTADGQSTAPTPPQPAES